MCSPSSYDVIQSGDPSAGVAFAGKIPHDYLHHLTTKEKKSEGDGAAEL